MNSFRQSMTWLHTWCGLVVGWVLFAIFFTGTIAIFRHEIDYWMTPELHGAIQTSDLLGVSQAALQKLAPTATRWIVDLPSNRAPTLRLRWQATPQDKLQAAYFNQNGDQLSPRETRGASMLYRFHYGLLMGRTGMWMVGGFGVAMLVALITGIIIHAKIFREFFTFRPFRAPPRAWLDAHTICSVVVLPFSLLITYSGLVIWWFIWMPGGLDLAYTDERAKFFREMAPAGLARVQPSDKLAPLADLTSIGREAAELQPQRLSLSSVVVSNPGTMSATVDIDRMSHDFLWGDSDKLRFDGVTGKLITRVPEEGAPAYVAHRVFRIVHEIKFAGPWFRWVFFVTSALSCAMIATGSVLWGVKRRARHMKALQHAGVTPRSAFAAFGIDALNVGVIAGICTATGVYFCANRLVPPATVGRGDLEVSVFFATWLLCTLAAAGYLLWRRTSLIDVGSVQREIRRLWGWQWIVAAISSTAALVIDQVMTGGISSSWRHHDNISMTAYVSIFTASLAMFLAAYLATRTNVRAE